MNKVKFSTYYYAGNNKVLNNACAGRFPLHENNDHEAKAELSAQLFADQMFYDIAGELAVSEAAILQSQQPAGLGNRSVENALETYNLLAQQRFVHPLRKTHRVKRRVYHVKYLTVFVKDD